MCKKYTYILALLIVSTLLSNILPKFDSDNNAANMSKIFEVNTERTNIIVESAVNDIPDNESGDLPAMDPTDKKKSRMDSESQRMNKPMGARAIGKEMRITTNSSNPGYPATYGNRIVWEDYRNGNPDIFMYDLDTGTETRITSDSSNQSKPAIHGNRIVWIDDRNHNADIYMYDIATSKKMRITTDAAEQYNPEIYGNRIVWEDQRNGGVDIYMYDLGTSKETQITSNSSTQREPAIHGNRIVWHDQRNGGLDIYMYDLSTSKETRITPSSTSARPDIYGNKIVWDDYRDTHTNIYMYDLGTGIETRITHELYHQYYPAIYGNKIVWQGGPSNGAGIYMYDLVSGTEMPITTEMSLYSAPAICVNKIVWEDFRNGRTDIYMYQFPPTINYLNTSKPFAFRTDVIEIFANATDFDDHKWEITPYFEYREPEQSEWTNILLGPPIYMNERWVSTFSIPINASLGYYDFRVHFNDTYDMWSLWFYLNSSFRVLNNPPGIEHLNLSKFEAVIDEKVELIVNGTDVEDELSELNFEPEYKHSESQFWNPLEFNKLEFIDEKYIFTFSMDPDKPYGNYNLRVTVCDSDLGYSNWKYLNETLLVLPAPPDIISLTPSKTSIFRTDIVWVYINCTDPDSVPDELFVELQYMPVVGNKWYNVSADFYETRWESYVKCQKTWSLGNYSFRARVTDWEENVSPWYYLNDSLLVLNNVPEVTGIDGIPERMDRKSSTIISINGKDVEDPEGTLEPVLEYNLPGGTEWVDTYLSAPSYSDNNWQFELNLLYNAPAGSYSFRANVRDRDGNRSTYIYENNSMNVVNAIPEALAFDQNPKEVYRTGSVVITAEGSDIETLNENLLCYIYYLAPDSIDWNLIETKYNGTAGKWYSELVTIRSFALGNYSFKVDFEDGDGILSGTAYANESVWVRNNLPVISEELDDIKVGKTQYILKLTDFGFDVETSKSQLRWSIDESTINNNLFHIEIDNIGYQEITIYPVKSKEGRDDISITLIDSDNGIAVKRDITINVTSKSGGGIASPDEDDPVSKLISGDSYWLYIIILIIIITLIVLFIFYRRKKQKEKEEIIKEEELVQESEETKTESTDISLLPDAESSSPEVEAPEPAPVPVIEEPAEPTPIPMPVEAEKPQLPSSTAQDPHSEAHTLPDDTEQEINSAKLVE